MRYFKKDKTKILKKVIKVPVWRLFGYACAEIFYAQMFWYNIFVDETCYPSIIIFAKG